MCKFSSKSGGVPFQPLGDLTWNDPLTSDRDHTDVIIKFPALNRGDYLGFIYL